MTIQIPGSGGQKQAYRLYSASYALVIGIDKYTEKGWSPLHNAVADAEKVANALIGHGFTVPLRKDLKSTELFDELRDFFINKGSDPGARLFLWFTGHGHTMAEPIEEGYLVPADAPSAETRKALPMSQFTF